MAVFQQQLSAHIGKKIVVKFDKDHSYGGVLQEASGDCLVLLIDNGKNRMIIQVPQVQFFCEE